MLVRENMQGTTKSFSPEIISRHKKEFFLLSLSEDRFRDEVVRPLFLRKGLTDGRDLCGTAEEGKDTIFLNTDPLGITVLYAVQTKKGNLNLSKIAATNIIEAITQLKTALRTKITLTLQRKKLLPSNVILVTSGKINDRARDYIFNEINDPRILFMDKDDLIPEIDTLYPELWLGIDSTKFPYLKALKGILTSTNESVVLSDVLPATASSVVTDEMFVQLHLVRINPEIKKMHGKVERVPRLEQLPVNGILSRKESQLLILGEAGSGKSTSLRRLAFSICERSLNAESQAQVKIPILLRANDILNGDFSLLAICIEETIRISPDKKPCFTNDDLTNGRLLLLVDALDEVGNNDQRIKVLNVLNEFHIQYPQCKIIMTSREYSFIKELEQLKGYRAYRLIPLDWKQADKIIKRVQSGKALSQETSKEILRRLQDVHGIELNPLLVTVFVATSDYSKTDIPANITELFKKYTEMMMGRWDTSKGLAQQFHAPLKDFLIQKIGFEIHRRRCTSITIEECKEILVFELESRLPKTADIDGLIEEMLYRSGLFRVMGNSVEFRHLLLQEFFAGRAISSADFLQSIISDEWWQRAIVFYFGQNPDNYAALESLINTLGLRTPKENFQAAITVGIGLQACYLVRTMEKLTIFYWVLEKLIISKEGILKEGRPEIPLTHFINYYIFGRDAVACSVLTEHLDELVDKLELKLFSPDEKEMFIFWCIVGLIECGNMEEAEKTLKHFHPKDRKLLLAIYLGCFLAVNLRVATKHQKEIADRMMRKIYPIISDLRDELLNEVHSELIELRKGEIKQIEHTT